MFRGGKQMLIIRINCFQFGDAIAVVGAFANGGDGTLAR